jgi:uncharacterized protein with LGFP repeats
MKVLFLFICIVVFSEVANAQIEKQIFEKKATIPNERIYKLDSFDIAIYAKAKQYNLGGTYTVGAKKIPAKNGGYLLGFKKGWVYYNPILNQCFAIWGDIMQRWGKENWEKGWLGYPISDHLSTPIKEGAYVHFENASIYYSPNTGTQIIHGDIRNYWASLGWENAPDLGFPKTEEIAMDFAGYKIYQQFEKGTIFWSPTSKDYPIIVTNNPNATKFSINEIIIAPQKYIPQ